LLPLIHRFLKSPRTPPPRDQYESYPRAMILVPNRELVSQILHMGSKVVGGTNITLASSKLNQLEKWPFAYNDKAPDFLVCTPTLASETTKFPEFYDQLEVVVLDEADMLLDGGFVKQVDSIILARKAAYRRKLALTSRDEKNNDDSTVESSLLAAISGQEGNETETIQNDVGVEGGIGGGKKSSYLAYQEKKKQSILTSGGASLRPCQVILAAATLPNYGLKSVDELVKKRFPDATRVSNVMLHQAPLSLQHQWVSLPPSSVPSAQGQGNTSEEGLNMLIDLLRREIDEARLQGRLLGRTMVFCNTASQVDSVTRALLQEGIHCLPFQKDIPAEDRSHNLAKFASDGSASGASEDDGSVRVLVCTDLASRGLDIPSVDHVIQFDFATNVVQVYIWVGGAKNNKCSPFMRI
jgi:superfamily II DNA/RNA helicase